MEAMRFSAGGATSVGTSFGSLIADSPKQSTATGPVRPDNLPDGRITSLVPKVPWEYKDPMVAGEKAFRNGNYSEAFSQFEKARQISRNCPESLLALTHTSLMMAKDSYDDSARYLAATMVVFPYLPLVDVNLKDFLGKPADYEQMVTRLENAVKADPKNGSALFVLGYLKMRDNIFPVASRLLNDAKNVITNREQAYAIDVLLKTMDEVRQDALEDGPKLATPQVLASVGLKLAIPEGFVFQPPSDPNQFMAAVRGTEATDKPQMINGFAYAVDKDVTARMALDQMATMMSSNLAVSNLRQLEELEIPYLGTTALARLYECQYMGAPIVLVRLCFVRDMADSGKKNESGKIMYVLGMGLLTSDVESLLPTFSTMARSVSLVDVKHPVDLLPTTKRLEVKVPEFGFAIDQPHGWAGRQTDRGYSMAAMDFLAGGTACPRVEAVTLQVPDTFDSKTFGEKVIQDRIREGQQITILSQDPAKLAGLDGHEFIVRRKVSTAATTQTATAASAPAETIEVLEMARLVCVTAPDGKKTAFGLIVRCQDTDEAALRKVMDILAGGFRLMKP